MMCVELAANNYRVKQRKSFHTQQSKGESVYVKMLEICVDTIESVRAAVSGGAQRIELCSALCDGGLTPSLGFLKVVKREFPALTVFCMLRPRGGHDFVYTRLEMDSLLLDMDALRTAGADGFVFGSLHANRCINIGQAWQVIAEAGPLPVTFHRAFDLTRPVDLSANVALVQYLGFRRLLTSGLASSALQGAERLRQMVDQCASGSLIVMAGSGLTPNNLAEVLQLSGCSECHGSGRRMAAVTDKASTVVNGIDFGRTVHTDEDIVRQLVDICRLNSKN